MAASTANIPAIPCETSNSVKTPGNQEVIASDDGTDSGYATREGSRVSDANTPAPSDSGKFLGGSVSFLFPGKKLEKKKKIPFLDLPIDPSATKRFVGIQPHFEKLLLEHVSKSQKRGARLSPMSTRLLMIGQSKEDAVAEIVVFCRREQYLSIKRFAKQEMITEMCRPNIPGELSFNITVIPEAPRLRIMFVEGEVRVVGDQILLPRWGEESLCGDRISLKGPSGQTRNATFGGVVKVVMENGEIYFYGMTAGHLLYDLRDADDTDYSDAGTDNEDIGDYGVDDDDELEIDLGPFMAQSFTNAHPPNSPTGSHDWEFGKPLTIGRIMEPATALSEVAESYDWALFKLSIFYGSWVNQLPTDAMATITISNNAPGKTGERPVYMIVGRIVKKGSLSSSSSRILVGPSQVFVDAYTITIEDENGICDGDSGSWVVDSETFELYGHLVASDIFNSGYVIPIAQVLDNIKEQLGASSVGLPTMGDCSSSHRVNRLFQRRIGRNKLPVDSGYNSKETSLSTTSNPFRLDFPMGLGPTDDSGYYTNNGPSLHSLAPRLSQIGTENPNPVEPKRGILERVKWAGQKFVKKLLVQRREGKRR
ncbi:hypothetical protein BGZ61DRAFT_534649 [Ilyonectria robusta]|uniref:uncharacterized protein n=1 Tax=Ilyonectria robusta TaxID=1079257 RepID=UPI001E8D3909|nr:uncharacterized protein BGZ61DRAFT_534649 [Ilyonectria robusta]KAH8683965.1 hypothetical protein BGZ61DRAFT_534649 [Ilyonectria robusta]